MQAVGIGAEWVAPVEEIEAKERHVAGVETIPAEEGSMSLPYIHFAHVRRPHILLGLGVPLRCAAGWLITAIVGAIGTRLEAGGYVEEGEHGMRQSGGEGLIVDDDLIVVRLRRGDASVVGQITLRAAEVDGEASAAVAE